MENYDPSKNSKYLVYLDANSLYASAMTKKLPVKNFEWMNENELEKLSMFFRSGFGIS